MAPGTAQVEEEPHEAAVGTAADYGDLDPELHKKVAANSQKVSLASHDYGFGSPPLSLNWITL